MARLISYWLVILSVGLVAGACAGGGGNNHLAAMPKELRGVWDGRLTIADRPVDGRLILGKEQVLILGGQKVKLIPERQEEMEGHFLQDRQRIQLTFGAKPATGAPTLRKLTIEEQFVRQGDKREKKIHVKIDSASSRYPGAEGGAMQQPVALAEVYGQGPRAPYFRYEDARAKEPGPASTRGLRARLKQVVQQLQEHGGWKLLAGETMAIPAEGVLEWQKTGQEWVGERLYVICCHEVSRDVAIQIGNTGVPFHIKTTGSALPFPAMVFHPYLEGWSKPYFGFQQRWDDPDQALAAQAAAKPVTVTLLVFGNSFGDVRNDFSFNSVPE